MIKPDSDGITLPLISGGDVAAGAVAEDEAEEGEKGRGREMAACRDYHKVNPNYDRTHERGNVQGRVCRQGVERERSREERLMEGRKEEMKGGS